MKDFSISNEKQITGLLSAEDVGGNLTPGEVYLSNDSRFIQDNFNEPLTTYAIGWRDNEKIKDTLDFIAPEVQVGERFEYASQTNVEEFLSETASDIRAIGADFKRIEYTSSKVQARTYNKGLTIRADMDQVKNQPNWREQYTRRITERLYRNELRRSNNLLANAAVDHGVTWDTTAGKDPDTDVRTYCDYFQTGGTAAMGLWPNRVIYSMGAWLKRSNTFRVQNNAGGYNSTDYTPEQVATFLMLGAGGGVMVDKHVYQATPTTKSRIVGNADGTNAVIIFLAMAGQTQEDASNSKRFVSPTISGGVLRVYEAPLTNGKMVDITVEHYSQPIITSTLGIQKLSVS